MLPVADISPSELVLAWNERHCPPLLETFATLCEQVAGRVSALQARQRPLVAAQRRLGAAPGRPASGPAARRTQTGPSSVRLRATCTRRSPAGSTLGGGRRAASTRPPGWTPARPWSTGSRRCRARRSPREDVQPVSVTSSGSRRWCSVPRARGGSCAGSSARVPACPRTGAPLPRQTTPWPRRHTDARARPSCRRTAPPARSGPEDRRAAPLGVTGAPSPRSAAHMAWGRPRTASRPRACPRPPARSRSATSVAPAGRARGCAAQNVPRVP